MTSPRRRAPLALRIAAWLLPRDARDEVLGDLVEAWKARERRQSRWARARWTLRQPLEALGARIRSRAPRTGPPAPPLGAIRRRSLGFSWIDVKLGVRMLAKQPILTAVAGLTLALGIPAALMPTHAIGIFQLDLPFDEGHRIVGLRNWDLETNRPSLRLLHDFAVWREALASFESIAAVRFELWNVHSPDGRAAEVRGSEVTASTFPLLRVPPLVGRTLIPSDETRGAADVVVISEDLWASRFARDPEIVGKSVTIGRRPHTIVGVMPQGFYFPMRDHLWTPLRAHPDDYAVGVGPDLLVIGRLADGVSRSRAEAEVETVGARLAAEWPETHTTLDPELVSFPILALGERAAGPIANWEVVLLQLFSFGLLAIVCGNIGTLILARTAMRMSEISVRTALGASRARILGQLFIEALVLSVSATLVGLVIAQEVVVAVAAGLLENEVPYWFDLDLSPRSIAIALAVGAGCAVLAGVLPAVKATSPRIQQNLQRSSRGASVRFGALTTVLIVAEVALSVGFLCFGVATAIPFARARARLPDVTIERYVMTHFRTPSVPPSRDDDVAAHEAEFRVRTARNHEELRERLAAHPSVRATAMGQHLPGSDLNDRQVIIEGTDATDDTPSGWAPTARVHVDYFRDLGLEVLEGRTFSASDVAGAPDAHRPAVVVNDAFVERVLGGGEAVGRRLRYVTAPGAVEQWFEIVGVVETWGTNLNNAERGEALYHPLASADMHPMRYIIEVAGDPAAFLPTLRTIAAAVDPEATIQGAEPLSQLVERTRLELRVGSIFIFALSAVGMILAATGLYALMSVTVSQRTREIGIRTALGARAGSIVMTVARRALVQLLAGVTLGCIFGWWIVRQITVNAEFAIDNVPALIAAVAACVIVFSALACLSPTLRGLRIQPTEALSES
ncbi:MAG: ABC transporter permease [Gemmatimonadota bacterium]